MRELVMLLTDVYLPRESSPAPLDPGVRLPGIEHAARFGQRAPLPQGWRAWLAHYLGRPDLAEVAPARVAAALLPRGTGTEWLATPLHLSAGLSSVHLDHRGLLRLTPQQLQALALSFEHVFAGSGLTLIPLRGEFLLRAPGIEALPTPEPARFAGGQVPPALYPGPKGAALGRTAAEIEMWLHAQGAQRGSAPDLSANALWLWGAAGADGELHRRASAEPVLGFATDAYLDGLWHLVSAQCAAVPEGLEPVLRAGARRSVLALSLAAELQESMPLRFTEALARLDARFIKPALNALREGALGAVILIANDTALTVHRGSARKLWRRARAGLASLA
jgi:hypothetical protein